MFTQYLFVGSYGAQAIVEEGKNHRRDYLVYQDEGYDNVMFLLLHDEYFGKYENISKKN